MCARVTRCRSSRSRNCAHVEARHRHDRRALGEPEVHDDRLAVDVEERQHADQHVVGADPVDRADLLHVRDEVAVREHHALRQPGRAARERQHGEVALPDRPPGSPTAPSAVGQRLELEHARRSPPTRAAQRARRRSRPCAPALASCLPTSSGVSSGLIEVTIAPSAIAAWKATDPVGRVRAEQADGVALADPVLRQPGRRSRVTRSASSAYVVTAPRRAVDQRGLVAALRRAAHHVRGERQRRDLDVGIRAAQDGHARSLRPQLRGRRRRRDEVERLGRRLARLVERAERLELDAEHDVADRDREVLVVLLRRASARPGRSASVIGRKSESCELRKSVMRDR